MVHCFKHLVDRVEWPLLDEWLYLDSAFEHQVERRRVMLGRAAPVAEGARIERHEVGQAQLDAVHRETDDSECCAVHEQTPGRGLSGGRTRALEDHPLGARKVGLFREFEDRPLERFLVLPLRVQRQCGAIGTQRVELRIVDVDRDDFRAEGMRDLYAIATDAACADYDGQRTRLDAGAGRRELWQPPEPPAI